MKKIKYILGIAIAITYISCSSSEYDFFTSIHGSVTDEATTEPVEGVLVSLSPGGLSKTTDAAGYFEFTDLESGQYTITVQKDGYRANRKSVNTVAGETSQISITIEHIEAASAY